MRRPPIVALIGFLASASVAGAQTTHLSAIESSTPTPAIDPLTGAPGRTLAALWADPTVAPSATGILVALQRSSYSSVRLQHIVAAFRFGPRWSISYASTEVRSIFDTSLTNHDPTLSSLRARGLWAGVDATTRSGPVVANVGVALAADENIGDLNSSTVARAQLRWGPGADPWLSLAIGAARMVGGSHEPFPGGTLRAHVDVRRHWGTSQLILSAAWSDGRLWRFSETKRGYAVAASFAPLPPLELSAGFGRHRMTYGASRWESASSMSGSISVGPFRLGARYANARIGLGSGFGVSVGYEPPVRGDPVGPPRPSAAETPP